MCISERQKRAVDYFIESGCKGEALRRAGYSESICKNPERVFKKDGVREYLEDRIKRFDSKRIADATEVMEYLTKIMRGEEKEEVVVIERVGDGMSSARNVEKNISANSRIKAAELLGKRYGIYKENIEIKGKVPVVIKDDVEQK